MITGHGVLMVGDELSEALRNLVNDFVPIVRTKNYKNEVIGS